MSDKPRERPAAAQAPAGGRAPAETMLRLEDLPPPDTRRWVARRKAQVVRAVRQGVLSLEQACSRYAISLEEYGSWERLIDRHGVGGLRVTRLQSFRGAPGPAGPPFERD